MSLSLILSPLAGGAANSSDRELEVAEKLSDSRGPLHKLRLALVRSVTVHSVHGLLVSIIDRRLRLVLVTSQYQFCAMLSKANLGRMLTAILDDQIRVKDIQRRCYYQSRPHSCQIRASNLWRGSA